MKRAGKPPATHLGPSIVYEFLMAGRLIADKPVGRLGQQLVLPAGDLVGLHVLLLRQLGQRLVASNGGQRHFGLECR